MPGGSPETLRPYLWRPETTVSRHRGRLSYRTRDRPPRRTPSTTGASARLAGALSDAGIGDGDRVATFCWNHNRHFETYFGVPSMGAQLHTINPLLPDHHIQYIVENAKDRTHLRRRIAPAETRRR